MFHIQRVKKENKLLISGNPAKHSEARNGGGEAPPALQCGSALSWHAAWARTAVHMSSHLPTAWLGLPEAFF